MIFVGTFVLVIFVFNGTILFTVVGIGFPVVIPCVYNEVFKLLESFLTYTALFIAFVIFVSNSLFYTSTFKDYPDNVVTAIAFPVRVSIFNVSPVNVFTPIASPVPVDTLTVSVP